MTCVSTILAYRWSSSKNPFPLYSNIYSNQVPKREKSTSHKTLTSPDPADSKVAGAVPMPTTGFEVHCVKGTCTNSGMVVPTTSKQK
ncbi:hypothetical protein TNCV_371761 [Trichonephila clavipes]|nr:hypothetical protein TNCV_371761 [Trichonephila clavipes]